MKSLRQNITPFSQSLYISKNIYSNLHIINIQGEKLGIQKTVRKLEIKNFEGHVKNIIQKAYVRLQILK